MIESVAFGTVAACVLLSAIFVVGSRDLVHAVLWLGVTLGATAAAYAMLDASFLAAVQVLLYVGGVVTLMIFGVMVTRRHDGIVVSAERTSPGRGAFAAAALFGILAAATARSDLPAGAAAVATAGLGESLLTIHVLAFEVLSVLLLAAIVGAVVIARRSDQGAPPPPVKRPPRRGPLEPAAAPPEGQTVVQE